MAEKGWGGVKVVDISEWGEVAGLEEWEGDHQWRSGSHRCGVGANERDEALGRGIEVNGVDRGRKDGKTSYTFLTKADRRITVSRRK